MLEDRCSTFAEMCQELAHIPQGQLTDYWQLCEAEPASIPCVDRSDRQPEQMAKFAKEDEDELEAAEQDDYFPSDLDDAPDPQCFRRIVLGTGNAMPLKMARDILSALREDISLFDSVQQRFSDLPKEPALEVLPPELEEVGRMLEPGELSEVIGTKSGMHILLRIS